MLKEAGKRSEGKDPEMEHAGSPDIEKRSCKPSRAEEETSYVFPRRSRRA